MEEVNEYVIRRKYKGIIIEVNVKDCFYDGRRTATITCKYNPIIIGCTDEKVNHFIERDFMIAKKEIDNKSFINKLKKIFK